MGSFRNAPGGSPEVQWTGSPACSRDLKWTSHGFSVQVPGHLPEGGHESLQDPGGDRVRAQLLGVLDSEPLRLPPKPFAHFLERRIPQENVNIFHLLRRICVIFLCWFQRDTISLLDISAFCPAHVESAGFRWNPLRAGWDISAGVVA